MRSSSFWSTPALEQSRPSWLAVSRWWRTGEWSFETGNARLLQAATILLPLLALPLFDNFIVTSKIALLLLVGMVTTGLWLLQSAQLKRFVVSAPPFLGGVGLLALAAFVSTSWTNTYPVEHALGLGGVVMALMLMIVTGGTLLSGVTNSTQRRPATGWWTSLAISAALLSLVTLLEIVGWGPRLWLTQSLSIQIEAEQLLNPTGSLFITAQFLFVATIGLVSLLLGDPSKKFRSPLIVGGTIITLAGLLLASWWLLPGRGATLPMLPFADAWSITVEAIKTPRAALIGVGPEYFQEVFTLFRSSDQRFANLADFSYHRSTPLHFLVTMGGLGLVAWLVTWFQTATIARTKYTVINRPYIHMLAAIFFLQLIVPPNLVLLGLMGLVLTFWMGVASFPQATFQPLAALIEKRPLGLKITSINTLVTRTLAILGLGCLLLVGVFVGQSLRASHAFFQSFLILQENDLVGAYTLQQRAVHLNPYQDSYRQRYALTNLYLAQTLAQKTDLTATDREQAIQLIQQAVREGRIAAELNPANYQNWQVLGTIYRNLIGVAADADQWAVQAYTQAIITNPTDAGLRLELAHILLGQQLYEPALAILIPAAQLQPMSAAIHHTIASTHQQLGNYEAARVAYQQTLQLLDPLSQDYTQVMNELAELAQLENNLDSTPNQPPIEASLLRPLQSTTSEQNQDAPEISNIVGASPSLNSDIASDRSTTNQIHDSGDDVGLTVESPPPPLWESSDLW